MATDTARVQLELASGKNESTAPFHHTATRWRQQNQPDAASVDAPAIPRAVSASRPPWIAFISAVVAVAVAVWWIMSQRMPDIDPREVIARNLNAADTAMAEGRYTDPPERSAFHYYSTVLTLDPNNADAIAGLDAIANRHLTHARVLLAEAKIAEAGVELEKARRVRPDHNGLALLDAQWRAEVRKLLAASTVVAKTHAEPLVKPAIAKEREVVSPPAAPVERKLAATPKHEGSRSSSSNSAPVKTAPVAQTDVANLGAAAAVLAAMDPSTQLDATALPIPEPDLSEPSTGANIIAENAALAEPESVPAPASSAELKLIKMVQPRYPEEALMRGIEGWVEVSLQVSPAGDVIEPRIESSSRGRMFNRAALSAVEQWKYEPRSDGSTSERVRVRVQFQQAR